MTKEQRKALEQVKAHHASSDYLGDSAGRYNTEEIGLLLDLVQNQEETLVCVKDRLAEATMFLESYDEEGKST
jgi:hypothetical protein